MGHSAIAFIIVIGVLVFFHELGHFLAARFCGVGVKVFSLGFGPKILQKTWGGTQYCISAVPLGGYVKMVGEEPGETLDPADAGQSFTHKSLLKKSIIVGAGPLFNFFLAIFIFFILYLFAGMYLAEPTVGKVLEDTPAANAGIRAGDIIKEINQTPITSFEDISKIINESKDKKLEIVVQRGERYLGFALFPEIRPGKNLFGEEIQKYVIGIVGNGKSFHISLNPFQAIWHAMKDTIGLINLTIVSVAKMISGSVSADNLGGPLMIAQMAGEQARAGAMNFVWFIALLSVNLGIINLFPIPLLDGGHLLFFAIEGITGKSVSDKLRDKLIRLGGALLVALMVFVFYNDIIRLINGG